MAHVPVTASRTPVYVHAKVMVVDDRLLRIGSSNLNNRSMGLDTECDLTIEARADDPRRAELSAAVLGMRDRLLAEHLDVPLGTAQTRLRDGMRRLRQASGVHVPGRDPGALSA